MENNETQSEEVVQLQPSDVEQESSNEVQETAQPETKEVVETPESKQPALEVRQPPVDEVDEMGVPLKNRLAEARRKLLKAEKELEEARAPKQQQPVEQKYTKAQLTAFAASTDDQQSRLWALEQLDKISNDDQRRIVKEELTGLQRQQTELNVRQQTFNTVIQRNPDIAVKDPLGNFIGFNTQSPLYQRMNFYMSNPEIVARPEALEIAEAFAMRDLAYAQKPVVAKTIEKQANQIKSLQKKTMVEGNGSNSNVQISSMQAAKDKLKQTGSVKDASNVMGEILRRQKILSDD
jgi:hypothetical protein